MKACMVAYTFYEQDNRVRRYAEALARRGDSVDVVAIRKPGQARTEIIEGVRVFRIQQRTVSEKHKIVYLVKLVSFFFLSMFFLAKLQFSNGGYQLIHVHSVPDFEVFAAIVPKLMGAKVILDIHDIVPEFYVGKFKTSKTSFAFKFLVFVERMSAAFANHVIISNHIWQERIQARSVDKSKCSTFINYPDTQIFKRSGVTRNDGKFIFIYPGTLNYHQGLDIAVRAFSSISAEIPNAQFLIYGTGEQFEPLGALISELNLGDRVILKGSVPLNVIASVMELADLGVVPKRNSGFGNEAFSTKILEFMVMGVPVIVPNTAVDKLYFNDSVVKFFTANDQQSLAAAMLMLAKNSEARAELASSASEFVKQYTWDKNQHMYLNLVDSLIQTPDGLRRPQLT
jgi:glycosyltransferase involved in cell wall biosynthesis